MRREAATRNAWLIRRSFMPALPAAVTLIASACASEPAEHDFAVRDSAGVHIAENAAPLWTDERVVIEAEPAVTIGTAAGDESQQLYRVARAMRLSDGRLVVLNSGASEIRFYSATGEHLQTVGRAGQGPGEFSGPRWAHERGDTIIVFDPFQDNGRISYLAVDDGSFIGSARANVQELGIAPRAILPDGSFLGERSEGSIPWEEVGHVRYTRAVIRHARDGSRVDTIAVVPGGEAFREEWRGGISQWGVPFGSGSYTAIGKDRVYLGDGTGFVVDGYSFDGTHLQSIRVSDQPRTVNSQLIDQWIEASLASSFYDARPEVRERSRRRYSETPAGATMPAFDQLLADGQRNLWVRTYTPPWETRSRWRIFDPDGRWLGSADLPEGLEIHEIGSDYVLGRRVDELGVEYVQLHRLRALRD